MLRNIGSVCIVQNFDNESDDRGQLTVSEIPRDGFRVDLNLTPKDQSG